MPAMKRLLLLPVAFLGVLGACSNQPTKEESLRVFASANTALSSAQASAVTQARHTALTASDDLSLNFSGPCTLGGTASVNGSYTGSGSDDRAAFDLTSSFSACAEPTGTLDGDLHWSSVADANGFAASMNGELDWTSGSDSASCSFDLNLSVTATAITYGGSLCGYDVTELGLHN
jgi:hypothetical protein